MEKKEEYRDRDGEEREIQRQGWRRKEYGEEREIQRQGWRRKRNTVIEIEKKEK